MGSRAGRPTTNLRSQVISYKRPHPASLEAACAWIELLALVVWIDPEDGCMTKTPAFVRADDEPIPSGDPRRLLEARPGWRARPIKGTLTWMLAA
jgi:hypothetical protein